jgi:hypothetical protein
VEFAFRHQEPDRTPFFEYVLLPPRASDILGRRFVEINEEWVPLVEEVGWEQAVRQYALGKVDLAEKLGHDLIYCLPVPGPPPSEPAPPPTPQSPPPDDPVERVRARVGDPTAPASGYGDDNLLGFRLVKEELARRGMDLALLGPAWGHGVWTDVDLMQTMALAPEVAHRHFQTATRWSAAVIEQYHELGIDIIGVGGDFAGNRPLISPEHYREFIMPELLMLTRRIHELGHRAVNASDGNLWSVIDDFLIGSGVDGYLEMDKHAAMELKPLKERFGDRITFVGNIDCGTLMTFGTPEDIAREAHKCLEDGWGDGGHVFCCSNAITASVSMTNYMALVNAYREHFALPPL